MHREKQIESAFCLPEMQFIFMYLFLYLIGVFHNAFLIGRREKKNKQSSGKTEGFIDLRLRCPSHPKRFKVEKT